MQNTNPLIVLKYMQKNIYPVYEQLLKKKINRYKQFSIILLCYAKL